LGVGNFVLVRQGYIARRCCRKRDKINTNA
jgi:hypothetical protein